jgi:hypothetical protein
LNFIFVVVAHPGVTTQRPVTMSYHIPKDNHTVSCGTIRACAPTEKVNELRIREQKKLLVWLIRLFKNEIQSQFLPRSESNNRPHFTSSLHQLLSAYFHADLENAEGLSVRRKHKLLQAKRKKGMVATATMAITKKVAICVLGSYYKSTDPNRWKRFFQQDLYFVNFFALLKQYEHHDNLTHIYMRYLTTWGTFGIFPWGEPPAFFKNPPDIRGIARFLKLISKFNWPSVMKNILKRLKIVCKIKPCQQALKVQRMMKLLRAKEYQSKAHSSFKQTLETVFLKSLELTRCFEISWSQVHPLTGSLWTLRS